MHQHMGSGVERAEHVLDRDRMGDGAHALGLGLRDDGAERLDLAAAGGDDDHGLDVVDAAIGERADHLAGLLGRKLGRGLSQPVGVRA